MPKTLFKDQRVAIAVGVGALAVGWFALHDAYERRGQKPNFFMRHFTW